jgi:peroxiredoxin
VVPHTVRRFLRGVGFLAAFGAAAFVLSANVRAADDGENLSNYPIGASPGSEPNRDNLRPLVGDTAPELRFTDLDGKPRLLSELRGKPVLLNFWATWGVSCRDEFPNLRVVHEILGEKVVVLSVSLDDTLRTAKNFVAKRQTEMPWSHGHVPKNLYKEAYLNYNLRGLPACFLIDADGKIVARELWGKKTKKSADEDRAPIGGIVVDDAGNPIEGAGVNFYIRRNDDPEESVSNAFILGGAKTGKDGRWSYTAFPGAQLGWLEFYHPEYAEYHWQWHDSRGNTSSLILRKDFQKAVDFEPLYKREYKHVLYRGITVTGIVKDEAGKPIERAKIFVNPSFLNASIPNQITTDADGKFRLARSKGQTIVLRVVADGFASASEKITMPDKAVNVKFVLKPAKTIRGVVFDDDGKPLAGAHLRLDFLRHGESFKYFNDGNAQTDSQGRFVFENMPEDELVIQVENLGKGDFFQETFSIRSGRENKIIVTRAKTEFRIVKVLDAQTGEPVKGPVVTNISPEKPKKNFPQHWHVNYQIPFTAAWGKKLPKDVSKVKLTVRVQGYKEKVITGLSLDGKRRDLIVKLERNPSVKRKDGLRKPVELQILTPEGKPAANAWVHHSALVPKRIAKKYPRGLYADKEGKVKLPPMYLLWEQDAIRIGGVLDEKEDSILPLSSMGRPQGYSVEVEHDGGYLKILTSEETAEKPVILQKWAKIKGKVLVGGKPAVGAKVYLGKDVFYQMLFDFIKPLAVTDKDGAFELTKLKAGRNYVSVELGGVASQRLISCKSGETSEITIGDQGRPLTAKVSVSEISELFDIDAKLRLPEEMKISEGKVVKNKQPLFLYLTPILDKKDVASDKINVAETRETHFPEPGKNNGVRVLKETGLSFYYEKEQEAVAKHQQVKIGEDGAIRFENVIPGKYRLVAMPTGQIEAASVPFEVMLDAEKTFDAKAQDLGVVKLERKKIHAGVSFPDFAFQGMQGKTRNSSEFRGKTWVLLLFDAVSLEGHGAYANVLDNISGIADSDTNGEKVEFLALHYGKKTKEFEEGWAKASWSKQRLGWLTEEQKQAFSSFGFGDESPQYFLVDKDGKVIATGFGNILQWSHLKKEAFREGVRKALQEESRKALEANAKK